MIDRLQKELKQSRGFESPEIRTILGLVKTAALVNDRMSRFLKAHGLTQQQYNVLRILRGAEPGGLPSLEIGERMVQRVPDVTRLLDRLESAGKIRRSRSARDKRVVHVTITSVARREIDDLDAPVRDFSEGLLSQLNMSEMAQIDEVLDRIRASVESSMAQDLSPRKASGRSDGG